jgi:hypothetical protein
MFLATAAPSVTETAVYIIVRDSVFGALLVVALVALYALMRVLLKVQDKRVADLERINERVEAREERLEKLSEKMTEALTSHTLALESLKQTELEQTRALNANTDAVRRVEGTLDSVIREHARTAANAARYGRSPTPPPKFSVPPRGGKG